MSGSRLAVWWETVHGSLWFIPALIVVSLVVLAVGLVELDGMVEADVLHAFPRLFGAGAEGTRGMLEAIAGATITVAGVTFSITIVALSLTSSQYSPRVLRNFMRDRTNQLVLGAFVGTYAYCLVVLRTIRGGEADPFVPSLATLGAILLAFVGIALLIHFIHHISTSIQASRILAAIHEETAEAIGRLYPERLGEPAEATPALAGRLRRGRWRTVDADRTGYVQSADAPGLLALACERDALVQLLCRIGDFVVEGQPVARVLAATADPQAPAEVLRCLAIGEHRTVRQDAAFGLRQLVDIALKALSPGINDVTTAIMCVDRLGALLLQLAVRRMPSPCRGERGELRVVAPTHDFASLLTLALEEIRLAAAEQPAVLARLAALIGVLARTARDDAQRSATAEALERLAHSVRRLRDLPQRRDLEARIESIRAAGVTPREQAEAAADDGFPSGSLGKEWGG